MGCCLEGNPKTEVLAKWQAARRQTRQERPGRLPPQHRALAKPSQRLSWKAVPGQKTGSLTKGQLRNSCLQADQRAEKPEDMGPLDGCTVNSFLKPKSGFESSFRTRATKPGPNIRLRMRPSHTGLGPKNGSIQQRREIKEKGGNPDFKIASGKEFQVSYQHMKLSRTKQIKSLPALQQAASPRKS